MRFPMVHKKDERLLLSRWVPALVLGISLVATLLATYYLWATAQAKDQVRFDQAIQQTVDAIHQRLQVYEGALHGGAAFFALQEDVTRQQFQAYARQLKLRQMYPGIQGFGFAKAVRHGDKEAFTEAMREQFDDGFTITPPGDRPLYVPVTYLQPEDARNRAALGFDMFSEPNRQEAIATARDQGDRALSGKVTLVQEIDAKKQPGFLIYTPVYEDGLLLQTVAERREKLVGFVYAPFRADDFFSGIFRGSGLPLIHFEVYDGTETGPEHLLHSSARPPARQPQFSRVLGIDVPGHRWTLALTTTPAFEAGSSQFLPPWIFAGGSFLSLTFFAITRALTQARSRAETSRQQAAEQREEYLVTLSSIGDAVIATDLKGRITFINPMAANLTRWSPDQAQGRPLAEVFRTLNAHTGDPLPVPTQRVLAENRNIPLTDQALLVGRDGEKRPIEDSAAPIRDVQGRLRGVVLVFQDVSLKRAAERRRQQAEEELRDAEARLKNGIQAASVGTWIWNIEEDQVFADEFLVQVFSVDPQQANGGSIEAFLKAIHPDDAPLVRTYIDTGFESDDMHETEFRVPQKDGSVRWFAARGRIQHDDTRNSSRFVGAMIDVTDRKRTEEALAHAKLELEQYTRKLEDTVAERTLRLRQSIEELEAFSYSLSHDLRAPLRAIQGFSYILLEDQREGLGPEGVGYLKKVTNAAARMEKLIQDVLAFSRVSRQEISVEDVDVEKLLRAIIHEQPEFQPPKAEISIESPLHPIRGHEASLTQCLTNLIENAAKFVEPGVQPRIRIWSEKRGDEVRLWMADNGIGMKKEAQEKLFEMFKRMHSGQYPGVGLGLAIVRKAVERMGGQAGVESEPGHGSRFWLQLPGCPEETEPDRQGS